MPTMNPLLSGLSATDRQRVEALLVEFDRGWEPGLLASRADQLPREGSLRAAVLAEMVKIDLERRWQRGAAKPLEEYLAEFPELGTVESAPTELIFAEYRARRGTPNPGKLSDYTRRFPRQADDLMALAESNPSSLTGTAPISSARYGQGPSTDDLTHATSLPRPSTHSDSGPAATSRLPEQFGRYRVIRQLGRGGMGAVYLAQDGKLDREVALKVPSLSDSSPALLDRFYREGRAAATLHHPNVCPVYDVGEIGGVHFLTMAYLEGETLGDVVRRRGPLPQNEAAAIVRKLALALDEAHGKGVIHRDLKPSNVMVTPKGEPVVMDFGLARRSGPEEARLTGDGSVLGTPAYMPPEQISGNVEAMGPGCDVYSLGVILYELVTGALPYTGNSAYEVVGKALSEEPKRPSLLRPDLSPKLEDIIVKAMAKKVGDRYGSMAEFAGALDDYMAKPAAQNRASAFAAETASAPPATAGRAGPRSPKWPWLAAALFGGLALIAGVIVIIIKNKNGEETKIKVPNTSQVVVQKDGKTVAEVPTGADKPEPTVGKSGSDEDKPLATGKHTSGAVLEVVSVDRSTDGLMKVKLRYKNPTDKRVKVFSPPVEFGLYGNQPLDCALRTIKEVYFRYASEGKAYKSKGPSDSALMGTGKGLELEPGKTSPTLWVVWGWPPPEVKKIGLVVRGIEDEIEVTLPDHDK